AVVVGLAGVPGAVIGTWLNGLVPGRLLLGLFGLLMVIVGVLMAVRSGRAAGDQERVARGIVPTLAAGFGIGVMTGFFGVGGGFLIVPVLTLVLGMSMPNAVGTSLLVIAINSAAAALSHGVVTIGDPAIAVVFAAGGVAGSLAGGRYGGRLKASWLQRGFAGFTIVLGIILAGVNLAR
ncbi:MAG: sulfite exporter TauE/SafE family protein, partial [Thermomicrobiales bacterium]